MQSLPCAGEGRVFNNNGFWMVQITILYYKNGDTIGVFRDYWKLLQISETFTKIYAKRKEFIEEPRSDGAGPHISLITNDYCISKEGAYVSFEIDNTKLSEYEDGCGGGYITLKVKKQFPFTNDDSGLQANDPGFQPHITIGRIYPRI